MFMHKILRVLLFTAHAEKHWKTLTKAGTNPSAPRGNFFKIENEEKIEWANSSIFQNAFRKKKNFIHLVSIQNRKKIMPIIANWFYWKMMPLVLKILSQICSLAFKKSWILSKISQYEVSDIKSCMVRCTNRKEVKPLNNISYFWTCLIINNNF